MNPDPLNLLIRVLERDLPNGLRSLIVDFLSGDRSTEMAYRVRNSMEPIGGLYYYAAYVVWAMSGSPLRSSDVRNALFDLEASLDAPELDAP